MKKVNDFLYEQETYLIRKACFTVWKKMGSAFKESAIDKALTIELQKIGLQVENQKRININYDGRIVGYYIPDKIINGKILFELKRKSFLTKQDRNNFWNYLRGSSINLDFLSTLVIIGWKLNV